MTYRRIPRTRGGEPTDSLPIVPKRSQKQPSPLMQFCLRIPGYLWAIIKVIWYWFERVFLVVFIAFMIGGLAWWLSQKPSNLRDWLPAESILPVVSFSGNIISIQNIRNHTWITDKEFIPGYYDEVYNLDEVEKVHYIIVPFSDRDGPAHTMLSFSFSGGKNVVISAEVRKERGESFDALKGILNQFEMMYVIGSEEDVIKLRTHYRKNQVYMYPIKVEKEKIQALFRAMIMRANKLAVEPEFYNTLWNNCATSILAHANALRTEKLKGGKHTILPAHSDTIVYEAGLLDTSLSLPQAREYYRIDDLARSASGGVFSEVIRKPIQ